ncbi:TetR/AcrR family transcriptional regulator [Ewingella americana]|jgi:AcrR family transcriptional regulator|uniref:TetR/AcrR family transcriptional regulator n=1 Tax=Ewingella americana TaxID=41202 RepID=A0A502GPG2_9GAMM|nr:TetR/AcrR family transcriptional regulator [Ewingella americana]TPG64019.1 TetR/AcrR family transcriptional regulator [Ewingella americana]
MLHPQESKELRIGARRDQIIAASRVCFRKHGFHGAGMAEIAKMSRLSVGQIYRYFANKDAIIEEIVRRIVFKKIRLITGDAHNLRQMAENLANRQIGALHIEPKQNSCPELSKEQIEIDHALMLEVAAEATRNPVVEQIWRDAERQLFNEAKAMLAKTYSHLSDDELTARVEILAVICEGTAFRRLTTLHANPVNLDVLYDRLFSQLFDPAT